MSNLKQFTIKHDHKIRHYYLIQAMRKSWVFFFPTWSNILFFLIKSTTQKSQSQSDYYIGYYHNQEKFSQVIAQMEQNKEPFQDRICKQITILESTSLNSDKKTLQIKFKDQEDKNWSVYFHSQEHPQLVLNLIEAFKTKEKGKIEVNPEEIKDVTKCQVETKLAKIKSSPEMTNIAEEKKADLPSIEATPQRTTNIGEPNTQLAEVNADPPKLIKSQCFKAGSRESSEANSNQMTYQNSELTLEDLQQLNLSVQSNNFSLIIIDGETTDQV